MKTPKEQKTNLRTEVVGKSNSNFMNSFLKGGPEPFEKEIHEILGSKREDRFSDPFFDWVQNTCLVRFRTLFACAIRVVKVP